MRSVYDRWPLKFKTTITTLSTNISHENNNTISANLKPKTRRLEYIQMRLSNIIQNFPTPKDSHKDGSRNSLSYREREKLEQNLHEKVSRADAEATATVVVVVVSTTTLMI